MEDPFIKERVKRYKYWTVTVAQNQSYLGRCVIWCDREDALDLVDVSKEEMDEFLDIIRDLKIAVEKAFGANWLNYSFLGNGTRHLHCHFVPRYEKDIVFNGKTFTDERWGKNWFTNVDFETTEEDRDAIKKEIQKHLS